jgi:ABC-type antimicrobial peptide transport system permease subunit
MLKLTGILLSIFLLSAAWGVDTCSRVAVINYQEVLVDVSSSNRGEGLRYYLQKDEVARDLLDEYQANNRPTWRSAAMSTLGSAMILGGVLRTNEGQNETFTSRNILIFGGATLIAVSYLISKTNQYNNEYLLLKSVEEYNKRNTPRIFFSPAGNKEGWGLGMGLSQEF